MSLLRNLPLLLTLGLTACGFEPLYKQPPMDASPEKTTEREAYTQPVANKLTQIQVTPIDYFGRPGQMLQSRLEDILNPTLAPAQPTYKLKVALTKSRDALLVERNAEITRYRMVTRADISLRDGATGETLFTDSIRLTSSFDAVTSDFATYTAEQDALINLMQQMATRIRFQLTDYFMSQDALLTAATP